jgi:hypothetical protein
MTKRGRKVVPALGECARLPESERLWESLCRMTAEWQALQT